MKHALTFIIFLSFAIAIPVVAWGASPVLLFSDITSGPKTGLTDDVVTNQGAIVTVWGTNLGSTQGSSNVTVDGVPAAYVYFWGNADGKSGGGPADLFAYHQMQEISFAIPSSINDGTVRIKVTVNGVESNALDFLVRPGNIYFVKNGGDNVAGDGSWGNPWATVDYYDSPAGAASKTNLAAGDIIYVYNVIENHRVNIRGQAGTSSNPIALITYPGTYYRIISSSGGIKNYYPYDSEYWVFSKIYIRGESTGIGAFKGMRAIANDISDTTCADGQSGAISGSGERAGGGIKAFGNYIHDFGCNTTTKLHHVFYLSNRSGLPLEAYELGWNYMTDNDARHALHIYDENACGDYTGTFKIHDNVVVNQKGAGFNANANGTACITAPIEVYNNLFVNCGLNPWQNHSINVTMSGLTSHIKFYNNTIYGYSADDASGSAIYVQANGSASWDFGGTWEWVNNIVVDTHDRAFEDPSFSSVPLVHSNNIWYDGGDGSGSPPAWDTAPITSDPAFKDPANHNYKLTQNSPAINKGTLTVSTIVVQDMIGTTRNIGPAPDIGALEYDGSYIDGPSNLRLTRVP